MECLLQEIIFVGFSADSAEVFRKAVEKSAF
jgi:hypothetical protein